jgi:RNA polymerase sigma-70 factor (ECF subfamily)
VEPDDAQIVALARAGDVRSAVDGVYRRYARSLRAFLRRELVRDDAVDDVLADVFKALLRDLPAFRGDAKLLTWLQTIARRAMFRYLERERARAARAAPLADAEQIPLPDLRATYKNWVRRLYQDLAQPDRAVVDLWLEGWTWQEAAQRLSTSEEALRKRFTRLIKRLAATN